MSVTITPRTNIFYLNFKKSGDFSKPKAIALNNSSNNILDSTTDWTIAVERFQLPIQTIPMFTPKQDFFILMDTTVVPQTEYDFHIVNDHYSLESFIDELNKEPDKLVVTIEEDGRVKFRLTSSYSPLFPLFAQSFFDVPFSPGGPVFTGATPIFDRFDALRSIRIETDLPVQSDYLAGGAVGNIISDYINPTKYSTSNVYNSSGPTIQFGITEHSRQNVVYEPKMKRYIILRGGQPVNNIRITATAIVGENSGTDAADDDFHLVYRRRDILLPAGTEFSLKLGFYSKSSILPPKK